MNIRPGDMFLHDAGTATHRNQYIELVVRDHKGGELMSVIVGADTERVYDKVYQSGLGYRGEQLAKYLQDCEHRYVGNIDDVIRPILRRS